jgi:biotin operon repressor
MAGDDAYGQFESALAALEALRGSVARQTDADTVFEAVQGLSLAVARCYGGHRPRAAAGRGARRRILEHFQTHLGEWIAGDELAAVSGIGEWARRVRELRLEQGYRIEEQDGMYRLLDIEPDAAAARRWKALSAIRRGDGTPRERVFALLSGPVGDVVRGTELSYVAGGRDASPLVRELRDGQGFPIDSAMDCRELRGDEFRLLSLAPVDRRDEYQHLFPESLRAEVFRRDDYTCWRCRRDREAAAVRGDDIFYLQIHHLHAKGDNLDSLPLAELVDPAALATYCRRCLLDEQASARRARRQGDPHQSSGV